MWLSTVIGSKWANANLSVLSKFVIHHLIPENTPWRGQKSCANVLGSSKKKRNFFESRLIQQLFGGERSQQRCIFLQFSSQSDGRIGASSQQISRQK